VCLPGRRSRTSRRSRPTGSTASSSTTTETAHATPVCAGRCSMYRCMVVVGMLLWVVWLGGEEGRGCECARRGGGGHCRRRERR
jgi:hypothetical protein